MRNRFPTEEKVIKNTKKTILNAYLGKDKLPPKKKVKIPGYNKEI